MALVGLHGAALQHAEAVVAEPSPRLKAVIAYCHFRPEPLETLQTSSPDVAELAAVFEALTSASTGSDERVAETYQTLVDVCPDAWRGLEPAANSNLLGLLHDVTTAVLPS